MILRLLNKTYKSLFVLIVYAFLFIIINCSQESDDEKGDEEPEAEKIAILYEGEFGGTWCIDELRLVVDDETILEEFFESDDFPPQGWEILGFNTAPYSWYRGGENIYIESVHEGNWCAQIQSGYSHQKEFLVLPKFKKGFLSNAKSIKLSFYVIGKVSLCNYACAKTVVFLPEYGDWAQAYSLDEYRFGLRDYEWRKIEIDLTNPKQFYKQETEE